MAAEHSIKSSLLQLGGMSEQELKEYMQQHGDYGMLAAHIYKTKIAPSQKEQAEKNNVSVDHVIFSISMITASMGENSSQKKIQLLVKLLN